MLSAISISNLEVIAYHLEQGQDNGGVTREALALFLRYVAIEGSEEYKDDKF